MGGRSQTKGQRGREGAYILTHTVTQSHTHGHARADTHRQSHTQTSPRSRGGESRPDRRRGQSDCNMRCKH